MIDIIISYLFRKVNIAFFVSSAWCIMLSRYAHRASANTQQTTLTRVRAAFSVHGFTLLKSLGSGRRGRLFLHYSLITYRYSLFLKNSGNLLRYVL